MSQDTATTSEPHAIAAVLLLENFLPYRLTRVSEVVSQTFARIYSEQFGIARPEWRVFAIIGQCGRATAKTVCERSTMHKTKVSRAVATLAERGFLKRIPNPDDLREIFLELTPAGQAAYDTLTPQAFAFSEHLTNHLTSAEQDQLNTIVEKLTAAARDYKP